MMAGSAGQARKTMLILPSFAGGGAERVMLHLARGLDRSVFAPVLVVLDGKGPLRDTVPPDVPVLDLKEPRLRSAIGKLVGLFRGEAPDIVLSTMGYLNMGVLLAGWVGLPRETRIVVREANMPEATIRQMGSGLLARLGYRHLYPRAASVVCNAVAVRDGLAALGLPAGKIAVIPNPIDVEMLRAKALEAVPPANDVAGRLFVASGRLTHQKGFDRLIDWFVSLPEEDRLIILGEGGQKEDLQRRIEENGLPNRVTLGGFTDNPWAVIAAADAFLMPSRWEGMPNAALESLALGTPVIATDQSGGLPELAGKVPTGMLTITAGKDDFIRAMHAAVRRADTRDLPPPALPQPALPPSALPLEFSRDAVLRRYADILLGRNPG